MEEILGDEDKAKVAALVPDVESLNEEALAKKILDSAELNGKLRQIVPNTDPDTLRKLREIPAKFTAAKFIEVFTARVLNNNEGDKNFADRRTRFDDFRRDQFENWSAARDAFIAAAENRSAEGGTKVGPCIVEKLDAENTDDVLLAALGIPRRLNGDSAYLKRLIDNIYGQLVKEHQVQIVGQAQGLGITTIPDATSSETVQENDYKNINPDDYSFIANHLDIISYMLYRIGAAGVVVWDVQIRLNGASAENSEGFSGGKNFKDSSEQRDGFVIYHYTVEISGTMAEIRDAVKRLDDCYAVRRVYLVRNIALYAENNIVDSIFTGVRAEARQQSAQLGSRSTATGGRRRRPRSGGIISDNEDGIGGTSGDDPAARREEQKRLEEEYRQRQLKLDPDKRDGYGEPITAGGAKETFRAVIDVEYVVKAEK